MASSLESWHAVSDRRPGIGRHRQIQRTRCPACCAGHLAYRCRCRSVHACHTASLRACGSAESKKRNNSKNDYNHTDDVEDVHSGRNTAPPMRCREVNYCLESERPSRTFRSASIFLALSSNARWRSTVNSFGCWGGLSAVTLPKVVSRKCCNLSMTEAPTCTTSPCADGSMANCRIFSESNENEGYRFQLTAGSLWNPKWQ
jgi:hypothetical protein